VPTWDYSHLDLGPPFGGRVWDEFLDRLENLGDNGNELVAVYTLNDANGQTKVVRYVLKRMSSKGDRFIN
jgi:hypothetical protein